MRQPKPTSLSVLVMLSTVACRDPALTAIAPDAAAPRRAPTVDVAQSPRPVLIDAHAPDAHAPDAHTPDAHTPSLAGHTDAGALPRGRGFLGMDDNAVLARICDTPIERIERNRGGSTVSFRVWLAGGQRALFKPQQRADVANYRAELAAYRMSRLMGLSRVPPACGRSLPRALLQRTADGSGDPAFSNRVMTELIARGDEIPGAMLFWVPGPLEPVVGADTYGPLLDLSRPLPPERTSLAADLSTLLLFDFLIDNVDRWSGGNILRQRGPDGINTTLFMDNGASFSAINGGLGARPHDQAARLEQVQRFSHSTLRALRALTFESVTRAVADDPLGPCLSEVQIRALLTRRDRIVAHADEISAAHSESDAFVFP